MWHIDLDPRILRAAGMVRTRNHAALLYSFYHEHVVIVFGQTPNTQFLKQKKIKITEDLTQHVRDARAKLWPLVEQARKEGKLASYSCPLAIIAGRRIAAQDVTSSSDGSSAALSHSKTRQVPPSINLHKIPRRNTNYTHLLPFSIKSVLDKGSPLIPVSCPVSLMTERTTLDNPRIIPSTSSSRFLSSVFSIRVRASEVPLHCVSPYQLSTIHDRSIRLRTVSGLLLHCLCFHYLPSVSALLLLQ
ncbi:uncharacterized protein LOC122869550 [Siniperca chuatsi]|uniref:uncharacterized protein LOC122869550 n=1 Tax=Siniperca chuatsi TaxID=119488 RepID=UPI001CE035EC|nr:uncharacterized protein LOC122869550 [Siniperca chuatsi]